MTTALEKIYAYYLESNGVTTDTREEMTGKVFFALKGERFNGNDYAQEAIKRGAVCVVVDEEMTLDSEHVVRVSNVLETLQALARHHRQQLAIPVIGITGTNGKTTTKELISAVLSTTYNTLFTLGNFNNHIGVPLTLLRLNKSHQMAVIEMGANHPGDIDELCRIALPDYGIITNVGKAHLEGFGSFEGVIQTKSEMYRFVQAREGLLFVNRNNNYLFPLVEQYDRLVTYGVDNDMADVVGRVAEQFPFIMCAWHYKGETDEYIAPTQFVGAYNIENMLAAITIAKHFGVKSMAMVEALKSYVPTNNRSQLLKSASNVLVVDAYNANPTSMDAALVNFLQMPSKNKMVILGDMKELGDYEYQEHETIVKRLAEMPFKEVILVGAAFGKVPNAFHHFEDVKALQMWLDKHPIRQSTILIKGSHSVGLEKIIGSL